MATHNYKVGDLVRRTSAMYSDDAAPGTLGKVIHAEGARVCVAWHGWPRGCGHWYRSAAIIAALMPLEQAPEDLTGSPGKSGGETLSGIVTCIERAAEQVGKDFWQKEEARQTNRAYEAESLLVALRSDLADVKAVRDHLRDKVVALEGDVAYWQREAVRLGAQKRGCR
jgi:hypothetical protein